MEQLLKQHKIISINWACPMFPLASFKVDLVGGEIDKCDMQFLTATPYPLYLLNKTVETVYDYEEGATTSKP